MKILDGKKIKQIIKRLAIEIVENNYNEKSISLAGINNNGYGFAKLLVKELKKLTDIHINLVQIKLNPAKPLLDEVSLSVDPQTLHSQTVIVVDDVANTGRTTFFAFKPLMEILPKKIEVAVLVDRKHKSFPIKVDYVGLSLATTLKDNIDVRLKNTSDIGVWLV